MKLIDYWQARSNKWAEDLMNVNNNTLPTTLSVTIDQTTKILLILKTKLQNIMHLNILGTPKNTEIITIDENIAQDLSNCICENYITWIQDYININYFAIANTDQPSEIDINNAYKQHTQYSANPYDGNKQSDVVRWDPMQTKNFWTNIYRDIDNFVPLLAEVLTTRLEWLWA